MATGSIPVDLTNAGQVFACLGLMEAAAVLLGPPRGGFDWRSPGASRFHLRAPGDADPIQVVLRFLREAELVVPVPVELPHRAEPKTQGRIRSLLLRADEPFGVMLSGEDGPSTLPARLQAGGRHVELTAWGDAPQLTGRDRFKLWGGTAGKLGAHFAWDALQALQGLPAGPLADPFAVAAPIRACLRLDWRGSNVPLATGFSLNAHNDIEAVGYPFVELLGALGLSHARPATVDRLNYRYGVVGVGPAAAAHPPELHPAALRLALGAVPLPYPMRTFALRLGWAGQEGKQRAITTVTEESNP